MFSHSGAAESEDVDYVRIRLDPKPGDLEYLLNSDLRRALTFAATDAAITILDYGAHLSPFRSLFPNSCYKRADIGGPGAVDYLILQNGCIEEAPQTFDMILSTQVAEHVENPQNYFQECYRLLKPGGNLFLSTHGAYEDHGFPNDYQRWTAQGIRRDLAKAGFEYLTIWKLTTGPRAGLYQLERFIETTYMSRKTFPGAMHWALRILTRRFRRLIHVAADRWYADYRMVSAAEPFHNMYLLLAVTAQRPEDSPRKASDACLPSSAATTSGEK